MTTNSDACISDETPSDTGLSTDLFFRLKSRSVHSYWADFQRLVGLMWDIRIVCLT